MNNHPNNYIIPKYEDLRDPTKQFEVLKDIVTFLGYKNLG